MRITGSQDGSRDNEVLSHRSSLIYGYGSYANGLVASGVSFAPPHSFDNAMSITSMKKSESSLEKHNGGVILKTFP